MDGFIHTKQLLNLLCIVYIGVSSYNFKKNIVFFCLKIFLTFTNSVDPDATQHYAAFHLGLHCLQKYFFKKAQNLRACHISSRSSIFLD